MKYQHIFRSKLHFCFVQNIEIFHADVIFFIEETLFLYTGHVKDVKFRQSVFETDYFFERNVVLCKDIFADIAWYAQFFRRNQDKFYIRVTNQSMNQ